MERLDSPKESFTNIDFEPFLGGDLESKMTIKEEDEFIQNWLAKMFDENAKKYDQVKMLNKIGTLYESQIIGWIVLYTILVIK